MTGAFLRIKRNDKYEAIEIEHLTDKEREETLKNDDRLMQWLNIVCNKLAEVEPLLDALEADGTIRRE